MASTSLSDFPTELILNIYESFDDHHAITALNLTSRKFYNIWQLNTASIAKSVLSQSIDCFDLAQELLVIQGRSIGGQPDSSEAVLEWSKHLVTIASVVLEYYTSGNVSMSRLRGFDRRERLDFTQSHYHVRILVELCCDREAQDLRLQAATLEELRGMAMTADWLEDRIFQEDWRCMRRMFRCSYNDFYHTIDMISATFKLRGSLS